MSSVENFRGFINGILNAASEEIYKGFRNAVVEYEDEIYRLRRMLDLVSKPEETVYNTEILLRNVYIEVAGINPQLIKQESSSVDQHDPEPLQIKDEQEEPSVSQKEEHLEPKQEADAFMLTLISEGSGSGEELIEKRQDHNRRKQEDSGPTKDPEPKLSKTHCRFNKKRKSLISNPKHYFHACKKPSKYLSYASKLQMHLRQHSGEKLHPCEICGKRFAYKSIRDKHVRIHAGDNPDLCQRACHLKLDLKSPATHTAEKPHSGHMCGEQFSSARVLKAHLKTRSSAKPFLCKTCGRRFAYKSGLKSHTKIHMGDKPYSCDTCGRKFMHSSELQAHLRVHTGEKPYSCKECGKCFRVSSTLVNHMRIHTGEKPYSCKECGKCFTVSSTLVNHMRIHTGEKPYSCKECGKRFTVQGNLMRHQSVHMDEKPYTCETCGKAFRNAGYLKGHIKRNHKTEKP